MSAAGQTTVLRASVGISWLVQGSGVLVIDEIGRRSAKLAFPEATVWELLLRGHDLRGAAEMLRWIMGITAEEAQAQAERCSRDWMGAGWVVVAMPREVTGAWRT